MPVPGRFVRFAPVGGAPLRPVFPVVFPPPRFKVTHSARHGGKPRPLVGALLPPPVPLSFPGLSPRSPLLRRFLVCCVPFRFSRAALLPQIRALKLGANLSFLVAIVKKTRYSVRMGTMNLLTASFVGKVGEVYGEKQHGKYFAKAVPFSHAPHNSAQKNAYSAFTRMNRFAAGVTKYFFPFLGVSARNMLKHNAVASAFKKSIAGGAWDLDSMSVVITPDGTCSLDSFVVDPDTQTLSLSASTSLAVDKNSGSAWVMGITNESGKILGALVPDSPADSLRVQTPFLETSSFFAFAFRADRVLSGVHLHGWVSSAQKIISGTTWYTSRMPSAGSYGVSAGTLSVPVGDISISSAGVISIPS